MKKESKTIILDINEISDELYQGILDAFIDKAKEQNIDWNDVEEQHWTIKVDFNK